MACRPPPPTTHGDEGDEAQRAESVFMPFSSWLSCEGGRVEAEERADGRGAAGARPARPAPAAPRREHGMWYTNAALPSRPWFCEHRNTITTQGQFYVEFN